MRAIIVCATVLLPLAIAPGILFFDDVTPKLLVVLLACAACLLACVRVRNPLQPLTAVARGRWFLYACVACMGVTIISTLLARNAELAWSGSTWRGMGAEAQVALLLLAVFAAAQGRADSGVWTAYLRGLCISSVLVSVYAILQYAGIDPFLTAAAYHAGEGPFRIVRPPSTLGHSDYLAAFLIWPVFAGIHLARTDRANRWRVLGWLASLCAGAAMVLTGSRGAMLGLAVGLLYFTALSRLRFKAFAVRLFVAIGLIAVFVVSPAGAQLRARIHWITDDVHGGARLLLWRDTLNMVSHAPVAGFGPENFVAEFPRFQSVRLSQAYPDFYHESPHNLFLDSLAGEGVLGFAALLFLLALGLYAGYRAARAGSSAAAAISAALAGAVVAHQFAVLTLPTAFCLYIGIAMLMAQPDAQAAVTLQPRSWRIVPRRLAAAVAVCTAAFLLLTCWTAAAREYSLTKIRRELDTGRVSQAAREYVSLRRHSPSADLYFARRFAAVAEDARAVLSKLQFAQVANMAAQRSTIHAEQNANAWYNLAALRAAGGDAQGTEAALRAAIDRAPNWFKPHWALARLLATSGRIGEARSEAVLATALNGGRDSEVAATLAFASRP